MQLIIDKNKDLIDKSVKLLQQGSIIVLPTDTVYGLCCSLNNKKTIKKIMEIKKRSKEKPFACLVSSLNMAKKYAIFNRKACLIAKKYWPGALTLVLRKRQKKFNSIKTKIGLRVPNHKLVRKIIKKLKVPIIATSVNLSGEKEMYEAKKILNYFKNKKLQPDLIIDAGILKNKPSSVIDVSGKEIKILRQGNILDKDLYIV